jgi:hypothetical protein
MRIALGCVLVSTVACGSPGSGMVGMPDADTSGGDPDAYMPPAGYTELISRTWTIPPHSYDEYKCVRLTITEDTYITSIVPKAPLGTHHTVLSIVGGGSTTGPDGEQDCSVGTIGTQMLYASGVGTAPYDFPDGVGVKVSAGQQVHLNLHLYNAGDDPLSGDSGIMVKSQSTPPPQIAEMAFAGRILFGVASNNQPTPITHTCTVNTGFSLFALWPHMHQLALSQKVEHIRNSTTTTLHDSAYDFTHQQWYPRPTILDVQAGDQLRVTCVFQNNTGQYVTFGDSSDKEMCFAGLYRFPALNEGLFQCTDYPAGF